MPPDPSHPAPSLLEQVRGLIERTYDHQTGLGPLAPFIVGDQGYRRVCAGRSIGWSGWVKRWSTVPKLVLILPCSLRR